MIVRSLCCLFVCLIIATGPVVAVATELDEVIVTAQKREQSLQDVGISISAFSADDVRQLGLVSSQDLDLVTPGLMISAFGNAPSGTVFNIRGVSQNDFADHNEAPVAVYVDGAYSSFIGAVGAQMYDVERVEVMRGPQGTLFGRNATGGLVHIINAKPTAEPEGYGQVTIGSYDQVKFEGALGGPIAETLMGRLSLATNSHDGFVENRIGPDSGENEEYNARGQLLWQPSDTLEVLLLGRGSKVDDVAIGGYDIRAAAPDPENDGLIDFVPEGTANPFCEAFFGIPADPSWTDCFGFIEDDDPYTGSFGVGNFDRDYYGVTGTVTWQAGPVEITSISDYQTIRKSYIEDSDSTPLPVAHFTTSQNADQFSQELRAAGSLERARWVTGVYYLNIDGDYSTGIDSRIFAATIRNRYTLSTESWAMFAQGDYDLTDTLTLTAGLRWTWDDKEIDFNPACTGFGCVFFEAPGSTQLLGFEGSEDDGDYSFKVQADWKPSENVLLYAGITRGNKGGGFSAPALATQPPAQIPYRAEVLTSYEGGFKWAFDSMPATLNGSVFYYDYENYQAFNLVNISQIVFNADAHVLGGELELKATPAEGLYVSLGLSALDGTVEDLTLPSGRLADRELPAAPDISLFALARKEWTLGETGMIALQGHLSYVDDFYIRTMNHPAESADDYVLVNARLSYRTLNEAWEFAVFANNLFDEEYVEAGYDDTQVNGVINRTYGSPRWIGGSVSYQWGR